jgi:hypothetical protein
VLADSKRNTRWGRHQQGAHPTHRILGLVGSHESEDLGGIDPVSRANQAAAFARISCSSRSRRFSRRNRSNSSRSAAVKAASALSCPAPPLCRTQLRIDSADGSNSRDSSSAVRPDRTNSTICYRNSELYGCRDLPIQDFLFPQRVKYPPKRGNSALRPFRQGARGKAAARDRKGRDRCAFPLVSLYSS